MAAAKKTDLKKAAGASARNRQVETALFRLVTRSRGDGGSLRDLFERIRAKNTDVDLIYAIESWIAICEGIHRLAKDEGVSEMIANAA